MKIVRMQATPLVASFADLYGGIDKIPPSILRPAAHFQSVPRTGQYSTLVRIEVEDGTIGYGEAWGLPLPEATALVVNRMLAPMVVGRQLSEADSIWDEIDIYFRRLGLTRGATMEALAGVDIALWDLRAKLDNRPVHELLGPRLRRAVECYASPIMFKDTPAQSCEAANAFVQAGFRAVKVKAGRGIATDVDHLAAVRDAVGPHIDIMVDVNGGYDARTAIALAEALEPLGVYWLEEPVPCLQYRDLARVKASASMKIAYGENDFSLEDFAALLDLAKVDVVMPNITRAGGITGVMRIARLAEQAGAKFSLHGVGTALMQCASLHVLGVVPNASYFEVNTFPNPLRDRLAAPAPAQSEGLMWVPEEFGLGCRIDEQTVEGYKAA